ncbi:MAG: ABC transporter ATP-binding protein, partial [Treponema sp.]|nr:ABC transporter ATP-binding protein [Treponema sp.]
MLVVKEVYAGYTKTDIIHNINFTVNRGESLCVLGPNGSGKSTLLKAIARIIDYRGLVTLEDEGSAGIDIAKFPRKEFAKKIAILSQSAQVYFPYTVYETVSTGRYVYSESIFKSLSGKDREIIKDILIKLDIWDIKERMINELSGGTLQRVFLARTLAQTPE